VIALPLGKCRSLAATDTVPSGATQAIAAVA
jgi:hypothetical protein